MSLFSMRIYKECFKIVLTEIHRLGKMLWHLEVVYFKGEYWELCAKSTFLVPAKLLFQSLNIFTHCYKYFGSEKDAKEEPINLYK